MLQDKKKTKQKKETRQEAHRKKTNNHVLYPRPHYVATNTLLCLPGAPASMLQAKKTKKRTNQDKHNRKRTARETGMYCTPRPHYVATNSLMSAWRTRFDVAREKTKNKKQKNQDKHDRKRIAKKQQQPCTAPPALTTSRQTLSCLPGAPA